MIFKSNKLILMIVFLSCFFNIHLKAETIFLKDGNILEGTITADKPTNIVLKMKDQKENKVIQRSAIMRVLYTDLKIAKVFVQKRSGETFLGYIVDEDRVAMTFRKELYKPEEFKVKRQDIMFISENNPSGLKPAKKPDFNSVEVTWVPPYGQPKYFQIYMRKNPSDPYVLAGKAMDKIFNLNNLESHTRYFLQVKAVDEDGNESLPSNEIEVMTQNIPPAKPSEIDFNREEELADANVFWNLSTDPDGKVVKYNIYLITGENRKLLSETKETQWILKDWKNYKDQYLQVTAVDDMGAESQPQTLKLTSNKTSWAISPAFIYPIGKLGDMFKSGFGGTITFGQRQMFFPWMNLELEGGFYLFGKNTMQDGVLNQTQFSSLKMVPLWLKVESRIFKTSPFSFYASVSPGVGYISFSYQKMDKDGYLLESASKSAFELLAKAQIKGEYAISHSVSFYLELEYNGIIESSLYSFLSAKLKVDYRY